MKNVSILTVPSTRVIINSSCCMTKNPLPIALLSFVITVATLPIEMSMISTRAFNFPPHHAQGSLAQNDPLDANPRCCERSPLAVLLVLAMLRLEAKSRHREGLHYWVSHIIELILRRRSLLYRIFLCLLSIPRTGLILIPVFILILLSVPLLLLILFL